MIKLLEFVSFVSCCFFVAVSNHTNHRRVDVSFGPFFSPATFLLYTKKEVPWLDVSTPPGPPHPTVEHGPLRPISRSYDFIGSNEKSTRCFVPWTRRKDPGTKNMKRTFSWHVLTMKFTKNHDEEVIVGSDKRSCNENVGVLPPSLSWSPLDTIGIVKFQQSLCQLRRICFLTFEVPKEVSQKETHLATRTCFVRCQKRYF